ncbi:MAG: transposase [Nitrospirota bacterium]
MKKKSSPRLKCFSYSGHFAYSLTLCTYKRRPHFISQDLISKIVDKLKDSTDRYGFSVIVYTFMPDHLHLLVKGTDSSDLKGFVRHFKQMTGYNFKMQQGEILWHLSYYDHVIRKDEDIAASARYILENPVRKGLVADFRDYPFSGSLVCNIKEIF